MHLLDLVKSAKGRTIRESRSKTLSLDLLPPLSLEEMNALEQRIPCPLPEGVRETLACTRGITNLPLHDIEFAGGEFGLDDIFPYSVALTGDSCGDSWIIDLTPASTTWGPVFYACHDPPVIVYQAATLHEFLQQVLALAQESGAFEIDSLSCKYANRIWAENPALLPQTACLNSPDPALKAFAETLDEHCFISDLRTPCLGDGFSWGKFGADTIIKRFGNERLFACKAPPKKTLWRQLFG